MKILKQQIKATEYYSQCAPQLKYTGVMPSRATENTNNTVASLSQNKYKRSSRR